MELPCPSQLRLYNSAPQGCDTISDINNVRERKRFSIKDSLSSITASSPRSGTNMKEEGKGMGKAAHLQSTDPFRKGAGAKIHISGPYDLLTPKKPSTPSNHLSTATTEEFGALRIQSPGNSSTNWGPKFSVCGSF